MIPDIYAGVPRGLKEFPGFTEVAQVYGNWTQTVAQKEVAGILPTLPKIDAVATQGGDGYGCAQAFKAAGREYPIIAMGHRYDELKWWKEQNEATGYETMSICSPSYVSQIALWTAIEVLAGDTEIPKDLVPPLTTILLEDLDYWLSVTPKGGVASGYFSQEWTKEFLERQKQGLPAQAVELPE